MNTKSRWFEDSNKNEQYLESIKQRFPEFSTKTKEELMFLLNHNASWEEKNYRYDILNRASKAIVPLPEHQEPTYDIKDPRFRKVFEEAVAPPINWESYYGWPVNEEEGSYDDEDENDEYEDN
jgi:hypothetical protein